MKTNEIEPILLTEEWLLRFGFEKDYNSWILKINGGRIAIIPQADYYNFAIWSGLGMHDDYAFISQIKFVHQLQNLYFALTGNELKKQG